MNFKHVGGQTKQYLQCPDCMARECEKATYRALKSNHPWSNREGTNRSQIGSHKAARNLLDLVRKNKEKNK